MTTNDILKRIQDVNAGRIPCEPEPVPYSSMVYYWKLPNHPTYLIRENQNGNYIGAVDLPEDDLHWFVLSEFRKRGIMKSALKNTILPHIFKTKEYQIITISKEDSWSSFTASKALAKRMGFNKFYKQNKYVLFAKDFDKSSR